MYGVFWNQSIRYFVFYIVLCHVAPQASFADATWQSTLASHFDIVDTFDDYSDWVGVTHTGGCPNLSTCDVPKTTSGGAGRWHYYEDYSNGGGCVGPKPGEYWIANHGRDYVWRDKSLRMAYSDPNINPDKHYDYKVEFNTGGTYVPNVGDAILGQTSGATGTLTGIILYPNTAWANKNAIGEFYYTGKTGTFQKGESVTIAGSLDSAVLFTGEEEGFSNCNDRLGPSRMAMYFGSGTPDSGYKRIHLFFMVKFHDGAFKYLQQQLRYGWVGVWKFYELEQGFSDVYWFGSPTYRSEVCQCAQDLHAYGLAYLITNIQGGGASYPNGAFRTSLFRTAGYDDGVNTNYGSFCGLNNCWTYGSGRGVNAATFAQNSFLSEYENGKWIGMEVMWDAGTLNGTDAEYEEWYYDEDGNVLSHSTQTGITARAKYDTKINKLVIGGNRFAQTYGLQEGDSPKSIYYIDDVVIDDKQIGPTYFELFRGHSTSQPNSPAKLHIQ